MNTKINKTDLQNSIKEAISERKVNYNKYEFILFKKCEDKNISDLNSVLNELDILISEK
ncbi:MAG: hypothetical protein ACRC6A_03990 [Fusobacteriaceae bacterium]